MRTPNSLFSAANTILLLPLFLYYCKAPGLLASLVSSMAASDSMGRKEDRAEKRGRKYPRILRVATGRGGRVGLSPIYKRKIIKTADTSILYP